MYGVGELRGAEQMYRYGAGQREVQRMYGPDAPPSASSARDARHAIEPPGSLLARGKQAVLKSHFRAKQTRAVLEIMEGFPASTVVLPPGAQRRPGSKKTHDVMADIYSRVFRGEKYDFGSFFGVGLRLTSPEEEHMLKSLLDGRRKAGVVGRLQFFTNAEGKLDVRVDESKFRGPTLERQKWAEIDRVCGFGTALFQILTDHRCDTICMAKAVSTLITTSS